MISTNLARTILSNGFKARNTSFKLYGLIYQNLATQAKGGFRKSFRSTINEAKHEFTIGEQAATPIRVGRGVLAGASLIGLGSLAFYGLGFSNEAGILDKSAAWPRYIRERVHTTYQYFGGALGVTAASAFAVSRSPMLMNIVMRNSMLAMFASIAAVIGSGMLVRSIPYEAGKFGSKQMAWALHAGLLGAFVAPMALLGGPLLVRAALYTAGVVGGLSTIAATAPSEKFLNMTAPLSIGLGVVFAASIGGMFLPPTTRLGLSLYSLSIYGGLILFSMFLLYDTQKIVHRAELQHHYDPVNESISIYLDTLNIFIRIAHILSGNRRK